MWAAEGEQAIVTAVELLKHKGKGDNSDEGSEEDDGPQMSG